MCVSCRSGTRPTCPPCSSAVGLVFAGLWQETGAAGRSVRTSSSFLHGAATLRPLPARASLLPRRSLIPPPPASLSSSVSHSLLQTNQNKRGRFRNVKPGARGGGEAEWGTAAEKRLNMKTYFWVCFVQVMPPGGREERGHLTGNY